nr:DUF1858 domain-containing protein [Devosia sp.]
MERWPTTIGVFIDFRMHCIGCPIGVFHTLADSAEEHGIPLNTLEREVALAIDESITAGPARARRRSARAGAGLLSAASAFRPPPVRRLPRR